MKKYSGPARTHEGRLRVVLRYLGFSDVSDCNEAGILTAQHGDYSYVFLFHHKWDTYSWWKVMRRDGRWEYAAYESFIITSHEDMQVMMEEAYMTLP